MNPLHQILTNELPALNKQLYYKFGDSYNSRFSVTLSSNLIGGDIDALSKYGYPQIAKTLQGAFALLFSYNPQAFGRSITNKQLGQVYYYSNSILQDVVSTIISMSEMDMPAPYVEFLKRAHICVSISYGYPVDTLDGETKHAANVIDELFHSKTGGGDPSLFVDQPLLYIGLLHYLAAIRERDDLYTISEHWLRLGLKGFPPAGALLKYFQKEDDVFIPEEPKILIELYALPSTRSDLLEINKPSKKRDDLKTTLLCDPKAAGYFFVQVKHVHMDETYRLPQQFYVPTTVVHAADVFYELKLAPVNDENLFESCINIWILYETYSKLLELMHKYFGQYIYYIISLLLLKAVTVQNCLITKYIDVDSYSLLWKENVKELAGDFGYDALLYLEQLNKIQIATIVKKQHKDLCSQISHKEQGMDGVDELVGKMRGNKSLSLLKVCDQDNGDTDNIQRRYNNQISYFLHSVYRVTIPTNTKDDTNFENPLKIYYDKYIMIAKRHQQGASFIPELISIPNISLHPYSQSKEVSVLYFDLGCFDPMVRLYIFLLLINEIPTYLTRLQEYLLYIMSLTHSNVTDVSPKQLKAFAYKKSGLVLSQAIFDTYHIYKVVITQFVEGEDIIALYRGKMDDVVTMILRIVKVHEQYQQVSLNSFVIKTIAGFPTHLQNEFKYFFCQNHKLQPCLTKFSIIYPKVVSDYIIKRLELAKYTSIINFSRYIYYQLFWRTDNEILIKIPPYFLKTPQLLTEVFEFVKQMFYSKCDQNHYKCLLKVSNSVTIGFGNSFYAVFGANQTGLKPQYGKIQTIVDDKPPITQYANMCKLNIKTHFKTDYYLVYYLYMLNFNIDFTSGKYQLLTILHHSDSEITGLLNAPYMQSVIIPKNIFADPALQKFVDRTMFVSKTSVILKSAYEQNNKTLLLEVELQYFEKQFVQSQIQKKLNAGLPLEIQQQPPANETFYKKLFEILLHSPQLHSMRMHGLRVALSEVKAVLDNKTEVFCFSESFGDRVDAAITNSIALAKTLKHAGVLPVSIARAQKLIFGTECAEKSGFPIYLLLIGETECILPPVCRAIFDISKYLIENDVDTIVHRAAEFASADEFVEAISPISVLSTFGFTDQRQLMNTAYSEDEDVYYYDHQRYQLFEHYCNTYFDVILGSSFADSGAGVYVSDEGFGGFYVAVSTDWAAWEKVAEVARVLADIKKQNDEMIGEVCWRKIAKFWQVLK